MSSDTETYARALELLNELEITGQPREDMLMDPDRATGVLAHARRQTSGKIRSRAALAVANWRSGFDPREVVNAPGRVAPIEPEPGPPTLSALEFMWSRDRSAPMESLLELASRSIESFGGFQALKPGFELHERYNAETGERELE